MGGALRWHLYDVVKELTHLVSVEANPGYYSENLLVDQFLISPLALSQHIIVCQHLLHRTVAPLQQGLNAGLFRGNHVL